jgi:hypothetical protein
MVSLSVNGAIAAIATSAYMQPIFNDRYVHCRIVATIRSAEHHSPLSSTNELNPLRPPNPLFCPRRPLRRHSIIRPYISGVSSCQLYLSQCTHSRLMQHTCRSCTGSSSRPAAPSPAPGPPCAAARGRGLPRPAGAGSGECATRSFPGRARCLCPRQPRCLSAGPAA